MDILKGLLKQYNFNFAWGTGKTGDELKRMVVAGMRRHDFEAIGQYVRYCIRETSLRETQND